jgi:hypothetical protein
MPSRTLRILPSFTLNRLALRRVSQRQRDLLEFEVQWRSTLS